jgi:hypothetical protein
MRRFWDAAFTSHESPVLDLLRHKITQPTIVRPGAGGSRASIFAFRAILVRCKHPWGTDSRAARSSRARTQSSAGTTERGLPLPAASGAATPAFQAPMRSSGPASQCPASPQAPAQMRISPGGPPSPTYVFARARQPSKTII